MKNSPKDDEAVLRKKKYDLAVMFALVSPDILHPEQDCGAGAGPRGAVGAGVWFYKEAPCGRFMCYGWTNAETFGKLLVAACCIILGRRQR